MFAQKLVAEEELFLANTKKNDEVYSRWLEGLKKTEEGELKEILTFVEQQEEQ